MTDLALYDTAPPTAPTRALGAAKAAMLGAASALLLPAMKAVAPDHVGGESLDDAWAVASRLAREGLGHSLGFWDTPADNPADVTRTYREAIARTAGSGGYVSIKPPALRFDAAVARELARAAAAAGVRLHCDSHGTNVADLTLAYAERLMETLPADLVSVSIPGRWARSAEDAARLLARGAGLRIVKGEWPDPADPERSLRDGFEAIVGVAARPGARVAVATHEAPLLASSLTRLAAAGASAEAEFIFGLQTPALIAAAARAAAPARIYVPYGKGFVPSALKALRRRPALLLEVARRMVGLR